MVIFLIRNALFKKKKLFHGWEIELYFFHSKWNRMIPGGNNFWNTSFNEKEKEEFYLNLDNECLSSVKLFFIEVKVRAWKKSEFY